ncbi:uncharacterized protein LOC128241909 [Mya arenaria]|uniref:uncharacterized protein LOC128241909 n=1 Tax=Mya arenaria TaxID=6604 RepID=UPI0022E22B60|nr:uncharacterized protein LOC128241909 [Mya arenaria]
MDAIKVVCIVCALVGALAVVSEAIKCYDCNSIMTTNCKDEFKKENIPVKENCSACMKTKGKKDGNQFVLRSCSPLKGGKNECNEVKKDGAEVNVCFCDKDICNGTPRVTVTIFTLVTAVLVAFKLM